MKNNLKEIREKKKMTQRAVADMCEMKTEQEYQKIERGKRLPRVDKAIKIAQALKKPVEKLWVNNE